MFVELKTILYISSFFIIEKKSCKYSQYKIYKYTQLRSPTHSEQLQAINTIAMSINRWPQ